MLLSMLYHWVTFQRQEFLPYYFLFLYVLRLKRQNRWDYLLFLCSTSKITANPIGFGFKIGFSLSPPSHLCMCGGMCLWVSASAHAVQSASFTRLSVSCRWNFPFMFMPILSFCDIVGSIASTTTQILLNERRKTDQLLLRKASADFSLSSFFLNLSTKHLCIELVLSFSSGWYLISYLSHWGGSEPGKKLWFSHSQDDYVTLRL